MRSFQKKRLFFAFICTLSVDVIASDDFPDLSAPCSRGGRHCSQGQDPSSLPSGYDSFVTKAHAASENRDFSAAAEHFEKAAAVAEGATSAHTYRAAGDAYVQAGRPEEAVRAYQKALALHEHLGHYDDATATRNVLHDFYEKTAHAAIQESNPVKAAEYFERAADVAAEAEEVSLQNTPMRPH